MLLNLSHIRLGQLKFKPNDRSSYAAPHIAGADCFHSDVFLGNLVIQEKSHPRFGISHRHFNFQKDVDLAATEHQDGIRLEILLSGELTIQNPDNTKTTLSTGNYWFNNQPQYNILTYEAAAPTILIFYLHHLPEQYTETPSILLDNNRYTLSPEIKLRIDQLLNNPYNASLSDFFYENTIREVLFWHLLSISDDQTQADNPYQLTALEVDAIISKDLSEHYSIIELARMTGVNDCTLKRVFKDFFKMSIFERLTFKRLEKARELLANTDLSILEISMETGYQHLTSFIKAFKKNNNMSPREWRLQNQR